MFNRTDNQRMKIFKCYKNSILVKDYLENKLFSKKQTLEKDTELIEELKDTTEKCCYYSHYLNTFSFEANNVDLIAFNITNTIIMMACDYPNNGDWFETLISNYKATFSTLEYNNFDKILDKTINYLTYYINNCDNEKQKQNLDAYLKYLELYNSKQFDSSYIKKLYFGSDK